MAEGERDSEHLQQLHLTPPRRCLLGVNAELSASIKQGTIEEFTEDWLRTATTSDNSVGPVEVLSPAN